MHIKFFFERIILIYKISRLDKIIFQNLTQEEIDSLTTDVTVCQADITQINDTLPYYFKSESPVLKDRYQQTIKGLLDEIKKNKGYQLFTQLFDIKAFNRETNEQVVPECLEVIDILNNQTEIKLPWEVKALIQYKDEIEKEFLKDPISKNNLFVNNLKDYKYCFVNDPIHQATINIMGNRDGNIRTNEIFNLYVQLILAQKMKRDFKVYSINATSGIASQQSSDEFVAEAEKLFLDYYKKIESTLTPEEYKAPNCNLEKLLKELFTLKTNMIQLKNDNIQALIKFNAAEIDALVLEIRNFLKTNNLNELKWPKVKDISSLDGGPGILKKINLAGGMKPVGKMYLNLIGPIIEKENIMQKPKDKLEEEITTLEKEKEKLQKLINNLKNLNM